MGILTFLHNNNNNENFYSALPNNIFFLQPKAHTKEIQTTITPLSHARTRTHTHTHTHTHAHTHTQTDRQTHRHTHTHFIFRKAIEHFLLAIQLVSAVVAIYSGAERLSIFRTICPSFGFEPRHCSSITLGKTTLSDAFASLSEFHVFFM